MPTTPAAAAALSPATEGKTAGSNASSTADVALGTGATRAVLNITAPVGIQIRADGRVIAQGQRPVGPIEFRFAGRAEIMIDDGAKVELDYAGWSHGPLGHPGRKRRIVLNSTEY